MIISRERKYVFVSTPKTGTHSLYDILQKQFNGKRHGGYHEKEIPLEFKNYFKFTTIRNPYERLVSAWNSLLYTTEDYKAIYKPLIGSKRFEDFVEWATENKSKLPHMKERGMVVICPQSMYLNGVDIDQYLKIEEINDRFNELEFVDQKVEVPQLLKRKHKNWDYWKNDNIIKHANELLKEDFEMFDYEIEK